MRIALLSYRSKTHCGGQGVYVRHLSHGLVELGHDVEVFSGQPYPKLLDPRVRLTKVPSLDLYREPDPFRVPRPSEIRDSIDLLELLTVWTAGFPEPRTFTLRVARLALPPAQPYVARTADAELRSGMVLSVQAWVAEEGVGGVLQRDVVHVVDGTPRIISRYGRTLT